MQLRQPHVGRKKNFKSLNLSFKTFFFLSFRSTNTHSWSEELPLRSQKNSVPFTRLLFQAKYPLNPFFHNFRLFRLFSKQSLEAWPPPSRVAKSPSPQLQSAHPPDPRHRLFFFNGTRNRSSSISNRSRSTRILFHRNVWNALIFATLTLFTSINRLCRRPHTGDGVGAKPLAVRSRNAISSCARSFCFDERASSFSPTFPDGTAPTCSAA